MFLSMSLDFVLSCFAHHPDLTELPHSVPTRRASALSHNLAHRVKPGYGLFVAVEHMERGIDLQPRETEHGIAGDRQGIEGRLRDGQDRTRTRLNSSN